MESNTVNPVDPSGVFANGPTSCNGSVNLKDGTISIEVGNAPTSGQTENPQTEPTNPVVEMLDSIGESVTNLAFAVAELQTTTAILAARVNALEEPAKNNTSAVSSETVNVSSGPKLSRLEASVLRILKRKANRKTTGSNFVTRYEVWRALPSSVRNITFGGTEAVGGAVRRLRAKTGLVIQAAQTTRRATGEVARTETGYRLLTN